MANHESIFRGDDVMKKRETQEIVVFGVGAVGSTLVNNLVRTGYKKVSIYDFDSVDADNVFSQVYGRREVGKLKTAALQARVLLETGIKLTVPKKVKFRISSANITAILKSHPGAIFVDCFDNSESRQVLQDNCPNCLHIGLAEFYSECVWEDVYRVPEEPGGVNPCEVPLTRNLTLATVALALEVLSKFIADGKKESYCFTLNDFKRSPY